MSNLLRIEEYKGYQLHINKIEDNPNGRRTQTVLIYKDDKPIGGSFADTELEDAVTKAKTKVDKTIELTIELNSIVKYYEPFPDEKDLSFTVIEIEKQNNWCKIQANVDMNIKPTYNANISDLIIATI